MISRRLRDRQPLRPADAVTRAPLSLWAFIGDDRGQDVIEYGLLSALFGIVCIAIWLAIQGTLREAYVNYDNDVQNLWASPNPGGS